MSSTTTRNPITSSIIDIVSHHRSMMYRIEQLYHSIGTDWYRFNLVPIGREAPSVALCAPSLTRCGRLL